MESRDTLTKDHNFLEQYCNQGLYPRLPIERNYPEDSVRLFSHELISKPASSNCTASDLDASYNVNMKFSNIRYDVDLEYVDTDINNINRNTALAMEQAAYLVGRELNRQIWSGNGSYREMCGLDMQLRGEVPRRQMLPDRRFAGTVLDFDGISIHNDFCNSDRIYKRILSLRRHLYYKADMSNMLPATWIIAMNPATWEMLVPIITGMLDFLPRRSGGENSSWECSYCGNDRAINLTQCLGGCGAAREPSNDQYICLYCGRVYQDDKDICWDQESGTGCGAISGTVKVNNVDGLFSVVNGDSSLFDWMMDECKIPLDGSLYDVVLDNHIAIDDSLTSIYFIPMTIYGNIPVTYLSEPTYDHSHILPNTYFTTDNGKLLWTFDENVYNQMLKVKTSQRVVMKTPQLAGVIENIKIYD